MSMKMNTIVKDSDGNVGNIPIVWGESRVITVFFLNPDGTPYAYSGTPSEILVKVFATINQAAIQKKLSESHVSLISVSGALTGIIGIRFTLLAADTPLMAANNSGLPMSIVLTDSAVPANVTEVDIMNVFNVSAPLIQT